MGDQAQKAVMELQDIDFDWAMKEAFGEDDEDVDVENADDENADGENGDDEDADDEGLEFVDVEIGQSNSLREPEDNGELPLTASQAFEYENVKNENLENEKAADDDADYEEEVDLAQKEQAGPLAKHQNNEESALTAEQASEDDNVADEELQGIEGVYDDGNDDQDETQSHFSDDSSDEAGWNADEELRKLIAENEAFKVRSLLNETRDSAMNGIGPKLEAADGGDQPAEATLESNAEEAMVYEIDENKKPWLRDLHNDGALLPVVLSGDDDVVPTVLNFFNYGNSDLWRRRRTNANSNDKPTIMSDIGKRMRLRLHEAENVRDTVSDELQNLRLEEEVKDEEIEKLNERLTKCTEWAEWYRLRAEQWEKAFVKQEPLANAERERRMMIQAGVELSRSIETHTSPVEGQTRDQSSIPNPVESTQIATEIDAVAELNAVVVHNDELREENSRLIALLEEMKVWTEGQNWTAKDTTDDCDNVRPMSSISKPSNESLSSERGNGSSDAVLAFDWATQRGPARWDEREQDIRKSARWIQTKQECDAQLNAWEKQFWANFKSTAVLYR